MEYVELATILPPAWLGILGGGQLGRMFTQAAQSMGYSVYVLDPDPMSPAGFSTLGAQTGVNPVPHFAIETEEDLLTVSRELFPAILKTARMGYDGKGQIPVGSLK